MYKRSLMTLCKLDIIMDRYCFKSELNVSNGEFKNNDVGADTGSRICPPCKVFLF
jgi:hypothetical protein